MWPINFHFGWYICYGVIKYKVTFSVHGQPNLNSYFVLCMWFPYAYIPIVLYVTYIVPYPAYLVSYVYLVS